MKGLSFNLTNVVSRFKKDRGPKATFGLDIGESSIKIAQIERGPRGLELKNLLIRELPFLETTEVNDKAGSIEEVLKGVIQESKISGSVVSSLSGAGINIEFLRLPPTPANEIKSAVDLEARNNLSFDPKEMVLDYLVSGESEKEKGNLEIIVVVAPRKVVSERTAILKRVGLKPLAIEVAPLTLVSLFEKSLQTENNVVGILEIGAAFSTLSIIREGKLCFVRDFSVSGHTITRAIQHSCELNYHEAEALKKKYGLSRLPLEMSTVKNTEEINVIETIRPIMERLVNDINRSLDYFFYQIAKTEIHKLDKIILCGGGASLKNFPEYLTSQLDTSIELANPLEGVWFDEKSFDVGYLKEIAPSLSLVIGLASREA